MRHENTILCIESCAECNPVTMISADEIVWPEGDEALPLDSQDLIGKLLRQNPLERLGTGASYL